MQNGTCTVGVKKQKHTQRERKSNKTKERKKELQDESDGKGRRKKEMVPSQVDNFYVSNCPAFVRDEKLP